MAFFANVLAKPIAEKLEGYSQDETENCELIVEGIMGIQSGMNPRSLSDLLATRLAPGDPPRLGVNGVSPWLKPKTPTMRTN